MMVLSLPVEIRMSFPSIKSSRITSYNVCYTKLLRLLIGGYMSKILDFFQKNPVVTFISGRMAERRTEKFVAQGFGRAILSQPPETLSDKEVEAIKSSRITSYNVCYTKLLRLRSRLF